MTSLPEILSNLPGDYIANVPRKIIGVYTLAKIGRVSFTIKNRCLTISTSINSNNKLTASFQINDKFISCFTTETLTKNEEVWVKLIVSRHHIAENVTPFAEWPHGPHTTVRYIYQLKFINGLLIAMRIQAYHEINMYELSYSLELFHIEKLHGFSDHDTIHSSVMRTDWNFGSKF